MTNSKALGGIWGHLADSIIQLQSSGEVLIQSCLWWQALSAEPPTQLLLCVLMLLVLLLAKSRLGYFCEDEPWGNINAGKVRGLHMPVVSILPPEKPLFSLQTLFVHCNIFFSSKAIPMWFMSWFLQACLISQPLLALSRLITKQVCLEKVPSCYSLQSGSVLPYISGQVMAPNHALCFTEQMATAFCVFWKSLENCVFNWRERMADLLLVKSRGSRCFMQCSSLVCSLCFASLTFSPVVPGLEKRKGETPNSFSLGKKEAGSLECSWICVVLPHPIPPYFTTTHAAGCSRGRRTEKNLSRGVLRSKGEKWGINCMHQDNVRRGEPEKWIIHCWFLYMGRYMGEKSPTLVGRSWIFCIWVNGQCHCRDDPKSPLTFVNAADSVYITC